MAGMIEQEYTVHWAPRGPHCVAPWEDELWGRAELAEIGAFHPQSSSHRPRTVVRLLYDADALHVLFEVSDQYVICRHGTFQDPVYEDACVEFFVEPQPGKGYFNFEMNCCGALLSRYIEDPFRLPEGGFRKERPLSLAEGKEVRIVSSLSGPIAEEIRRPLRWWLYCAIPFSLLACFVGPVSVSAGVCWRGNFNKCSEVNSHPHWATWAPIGARLDFHQPARFGRICFAGS